MSTILESFNGNGKAYLDSLDKFYETLQQTPMPMAGGGFTNPSEFAGIYDAFVAARKAFGELNPMLV